MNIEKLISDIPFWFHSINVGNNIVTPGEKSSELLYLELSRLQLPNLAGKSVLDIGAWDGFFSFECEKSGAQRVCALDHYVWCMDLLEQQNYHQKCLETGQVPVPYENLPANWKPNKMLGKRGFDTAHSLLNSRVEQKVLNFMECDILEIGSFDIVLFLGVLYHLKNPFEGMCRLSMLTRDLAIIETAAVIVPGAEERPLFEFCGRNELIGDVGNWWLPTQKAMIDMCLASGFKSAEVIHVIPHIEGDGSHSHEICRIVVHANH